MKNRIAISSLAAVAVLAGAVAVPEAAFARHHRYHHRYSRTYSHPRYYGQAQYPVRCSGGDGAVGTIAGGAGGALIGHAIGGDTLGTVAGGVGGALLGRTLDKQNTRHRNGC